ncbi:MAG: ABC transporter ATP-binding protein [Bdellovibrionaceae bacterium]|nr:ABC transporter ATP-binding protein [Pseudobdellovibrionaceae bacterium]
MESLLSVSQLKFKYPNTDRGRLEIDQFTVKKGEKIFLFGPSGSGKTTFLEILAGVLLPSSGQLEIDGTDIARLSSSARDAYRADKIGYIFQSFNLIPYLSVYENITLPCKLSSEKNKFISNLDHIVEHLGIKDLLHQKTTELSVGQQQRVAAARALLGQPKLILADEPTSALDFDHREKFLKLLFDLCREHSITLMFVSHDRSLQNMFDRVVALSELNRFVAPAAPVSAASISGSPSVSTSASTSNLTDSNSDSGSDSNSTSRGTR